MDPDAVPKRSQHQAPDDPGTGPGPVPEDNRQGHHPDHDQDQPDLDAFAERLGIPSDDEHDEPDQHEDRDHDEVTPAPSAVAPDTSAVAPADEPAATGRGGSPSPTQALAGTAVGAARLAISIPLHALRIGAGLAGASLRAVRRALPGPGSDTGRDTDADTDTD